MVKDTKIEKIAHDNKISKQREYIFAVGRRKEAVARVRVYADPKEVILWHEQGAQKGEILVNQQPIAAYFGGDAVGASYMHPFEITNTVGKFAVTVKVAGGGKQSQLEALIQGIAKALDAYDKKTFRPLLKKKGLLSRDARVRQRRKIGMGGKSRRKKQSPKR